MPNHAPLESRPPLIAALLRPDAYPHPVSEPIRLAETHISWVVLTGELAYKIKKPVSLAFLDYSTVDRRLAFCAEELRLNRRHAPGLYLGVSRITGSPAAPTVDGPGEPIEHAVRMRQFAARDELPSLLAADAVTADEVAELGGDVARLHAAAMPTPVDAAWGRAATVERITVDNFAELRRLPEGIECRDALQSIESRLLDSRQVRTALLERRHAAGWVREGHGDLHCGNIVRWQGRLTPFDGIEFDPALRFIDVVNDLAFLSMDLAERGHDELRVAALQAWLDALGDFDGLVLLRYYEIYRALVRAKVASLRASQDGASDRPSSAGECTRYLTWAESRGQRRRPFMLITCGLSGSGKTWLARHLRSAIGALHVRSDVERKRLAGLPADADSRSPPDGGIYSQAFTLRTYDRLRECAAAAVSGGESIIVDAAFLRRDERASFLDLARTLGARFAILHCTAPRDVLAARVAARRAAGSDASEASVELLSRQPSWWQDFGDAERPRVVEIDAGASGDMAGLLERLCGLPD